MSDGNLIAPMALDWSQVASATAEQSSAAILVVDANGQIRAANRAAERTLGIARRTLLERELSSVLGSVGGAPGESDFLRGLHVHPRRKRRCLLTNHFRAGQLLAVDIEPVGHDATGGLVLTVHSVIAQPGRVTADVDLEVESGDSFGTLTRLSVMGRSYEAESFAGRRCYELLRHKQSPCDECPALQALDDGADAVMVGVDPADENAFVAVSARRAEAQHVRVTERHLTGHVLRSALGAMIAALARGARLSGRESQVLDGLARGRSLEQIAQHLEISARTVKFHQTNVLQKLGIGSRQDVLRLLMERQGAAPLR